MAITTNLKNNKTSSKSDELPVNIKIDKSDRAKLATALASALADTEMLFMKSQYYHWNVTGSNFFGLHRLFEEHYNALKEKGDEIAERIRALGFMSPGTFREILQLSGLKEDSQLPGSWEKMVENLMQDHEYCSGGARKVMDLADKAGDDVTSDMMIEHMQAHETAAWMLRSTLEGHALQSIAKSRN